MTEDEARKVELLCAIEGEDRDAVLLTREDREQADNQARAHMGEGRARQAEDRFIAQRAEFATTRLATRHPGIAALLQRSRWPRWVSIVVPLVALIAGFLANELGTDKRLNLLAVPLLGTIGWNLLVYLWLLATAVMGKGGSATDPISRLTGWLAGVGRRDFDQGSAMHRAASSFQDRWARLSGRINTARIGRTLHLSAALFALGLIGGIYARALVIEYRAGWESTFLGPGAVHALLSLVLGPASWVSGVAIPPVDQIAAMRWTGANSGGVNAGPWLHLYTVTIAGLVVVPRLALAAWQGAIAWRLARRFPMPGREDFYIRRLLRAAGARPGSVRVTPYAYRPDEGTRRRLTAALRAALGDGALIRFDEPVDYGAEDRWTESYAPDPADDYHLLLFTLSATPEAENHGALATALNQRIASDQAGTALAAMIDESPYRAHFAGQSGLDERVAGRMGSWRQVLGTAGITPFAIDLADETQDGLAERLEGGLLTDGAMRK